MAAERLLLAYWLFISTFFALHFDIIKYKIIKKYNFVIVLHFHVYEVRKVGA